MCDDLTGLERIAFVNQLINDATRQLCGNIDLGRLDPPVAAGETGRQLRGLKVFPARVGEAANHGDRRDEKHPFSFMPRSRDFRFSGFMTPLLRGSGRGIYFLVAGCRCSSLCQD